MPSVYISQVLTELSTEGGQRHFSLSEDHRDALQLMAMNQCGNSRNNTVYGRQDVRDGGSAERHSGNKRAERESSEGDDLGERRHGSKECRVLKSEGRAWAEKEGDG